MNYYFFFFTLYAVFIAPITFRFSLRLGRRAGFGFRFQVSGFPIMRRRAHNDLEGEKPIREHEVAESLVKSDLALVRALLSPRFRRTLRRAAELRVLTLHACFSFEDACKTALWYALTRELWRTVALCASPRCELNGHVEANFEGRGTEVLARGIITARLGSISHAAILFGALYLEKRAALQAAEEDKHAAAPD